MHRAMSSSGGGRTARRPGAPWARAAVLAGIGLLFVGPGAAEEVRITVDRLDVESEDLRAAADEAHGHLKEEALEVIEEAGLRVCGDDDAGEGPCFRVDQWDFGLGTAPSDEVLPLLTGQPYHFAALVHGRTGRAADGATMNVRSRVATHPRRVLHIDFDYRAERWLEFRQLFRAALLYSVARAEATVGAADAAGIAAVLASAHAELNDFAAYDGACAEGIGAWAQALGAGDEPPPSEPVEGASPAEASSAGDAAEEVASPAPPASPAEPASAPGGVDVIGLGDLCADIARGLAEIDAELRGREGV